MSSRPVISTTRPKVAADRHRLTAFKKLKLKTIPAMVEDEDSPAVERWAKRMEIAENLVRRNLSDAERADLQARLKALHEEERPETAKGQAQAAGTNRARGRRSQVGTDDASAFADYAAKLTGRSRTAVVRDVQRAEALGPDIQRVVGTSLDKGVKFDALAKMPAEQREPIIARAEAGAFSEAPPSRAAQAPRQSQV